MSIRSVVELGNKSVCVAKRRHRRVRRIKNFDDWSSERFAILKPVQLRSKCLQYSDFAEPMQYYCMNPYTKSIEVQTIFMFFHRKSNENHSKNMFHVINTTCLIRKHCLAMFPTISERTNCLQVVFASISLRKYDF